MTLRLNLGQYLKEHGITAYRLVQEMEGKVASNTVYGMARRPAQRIDLQTVSEVLQALQRVNGKPVRITDILEDVQADVQEVETPTLEHLLSTVAPYDSAAQPNFSSQVRKRFKIGGSLSVSEIVSEGRSR